MPKPLPNTVWTGMSPLQVAEVVDVVIHVDDILRTREPPMSRIAIIILSTWISVPVAACNPGGPATSSPTGVQDCDEYITKVEACLAKNLALKASAEQAFRVKWDAVKQIAVTDKATVMFQCKMSLSTLASAMPGCS